MIAMVQMRLHAFLYTSSPFITAMSITTFLVLSLFGFLEMLGIHLQYSKLWNVNSRRSSIKVSSTAGMLFLYTPAFLFGLSSFGLFPDYDFRCGLVASALTVHFLKRILEVRTPLLTIFPFFFSLDSHLRLVFWFGFLMQKAWKIWLIMSGNMNVFWWVSFKGKPIEGIRGLFVWSDCFMFLFSNKIEIMTYLDFFYFLKKL